MTEDDTTLADYLESKIRVLCWVMTSPDNLEKKAIHVYRTWAHKCNKLIFVSSQENNTFPAPVISKLKALILRLSANSCYIVPRLSYDLPSKIPRLSPFLCSLIFRL